jgi:glycosyltransferase involved in cell wall biosynthesis
MAGDLKELVRPYYLKWLYFRLGAGNRPSHFTECWNFPWSVIEPSEPWCVPALPDREDFLFLPMADWHTRIQRTQHLAQTFAALGHRCFYLNPNLGREFPSTYFTSPQRIVSRLAPRILELHVHLPREPVFHHRCLRPEENRAVTDAINQIVKGAASRRLTLIASFPLWTDVAVRLKKTWNCRLVYDCHDHLAGFGNISEDLLASEERLMTASDIVAFSAQGLMDRALASGTSAPDRSLLLRNAVCSDDFQSVFDRGRGSESGRQKTIGYVGSLNFWFDVEAVRLAARKHPEWRFALVGRVECESVRALEKLPNVDFRGEVAYANIPDCLATFDAALIPFARMPLTLATNPIKLYEYFACGLPVVSTRLPEVEQYDGLVYLARDAEEFASQLEVAVAEDDAALRTRRHRVAERESWLARCTTLERALSSTAPSQ